MNRPDKAGEPSMEEILASIRQIIADDTPSDQDPIIEPNPLVPQSAAAERSGEISHTEVRTPLVDRLSDVLKSGPLPPTSPLGSKRPLSFDQDLADMFDEGDAASSPVPKPDLRVPLDLAATVKAPQTPDEDAPRPEPAKSAEASHGGPAISSPAASATSDVPPMPFGGVSAPAAATEPAPMEPAVAPPKTFGFPPLRKQSFYPPQPKTPELPPIPEKEPMSSDAASAAGADDDKGGLDEAIARLSGLGAVVPGQSSGTAMGTGALNGMRNGSGSLNGAGAFNGMNSGASAGVPGNQDATASALKTPGFSMAAGISPAALKPDSAVTPSAKASSVQEHVSSHERDTPFASFGGAAATPIARDPAPSFGSEPSFGAASSFRSNEPARASDAAQALDALAQGLAASAAASSSASHAAAAQPAIPLVEPIVEPAPRGARPAGGVPPVQNLPATQANPAPRTLEDTVADMLRPMLQQWVSENMPRIIEKALRNEVAGTGKSDSSSRS